MRINDDMMTAITAGLTGKEMANIPFTNDDSTDSGIYDTF